MSPISLSLFNRPSVHTGATRLEAFSDITPLPSPSLFFLSVFPLASLYPSILPWGGEGGGCGWAGGGGFKSCGGMKVVSHQSSTHWQANPAAATPKTHSHSCIYTRMVWRVEGGLMESKLLQCSSDPCPVHLTSLPPPSRCDIESGTQTVTSFHFHFHHHD